MKKTNIKFFTATFLLSILISLLITPLRGIMLYDDVAGVRLCSILGFILYFIATILLYKKYSNQHSLNFIIFPILCGILLLQVPLRIIAFNATLSSIPDFIMHLMGIVFAYFACKFSWTKKLLFIVGLIICLFMYFKGYDLWHNKLYFDNFTGKTKRYNINFEAKDQKGNTINLKQLKGKIVVLEFWNLNCGTCFRKFPLLENLYNKYKTDQRLVITGVNVSYPRDSIGAAFQVLKEKGYTFPTLIINKENCIIKEIPIKAYPTVIIFDKTGTLIYQGNIKNADMIIKNINT